MKTSFCFLILAVSLMASNGFAQGKPAAAEPAAAELKLVADPKSAAEPRPADCDFHKIIDEKEVGKFLGKYSGVWIPADPDQETYTLELAKGTDGIQKDKLIVSYAWGTDDAALKAADKYYAEIKKDRIETDYRSMGNVLVELFLCKNGKLLGIYTNKGDKKKGTGLFSRVIN